MQAEFKRENHKSYFVVNDQRINDCADDDLYDLNMLSENQIEGLLPMSIHSFNGKTEIYYDISTKQTLEILYEKRELRKGDLEILFKEIEKTIINLEKYLLEMEKLIIDPAYIYMDVARRKIYLLYYPFCEENFEESVYQFADYILDKICNEDEQTVVYAYNFYRLVKEEKGDLFSVLQMLESDPEETKNSSMDKRYIVENMDTPQSRSNQSEMDDYDFDDIDFIDGLRKNARTEDDDSEKQNEKEEDKKRRIIRISCFGIIGLLGLGIMTYYAWEYQLSFEELLVKQETIVGLALIVVAIVGFIIVTVYDHINTKKSTLISEKLNDKSEFKDLDTFDGSSFFDISDYDESKSDNINIQDTEKSESDLKSMYETVLVQENCYSEQRILRGKIKGKMKEIDLSSFPFIIGKSKDQVDFVIDDSSISRVHARFTLRDDLVFLTDLNSTNGTMKNGIKLQPNELVLLESEDEIKFGRLSFTYL